MVFALDNVTVYVIFLMAYLVRFNFASAEFDINTVLLQGVIVTAVYMLFSRIFHSYSGILRHTTLTDVTLLFIVTTCSLILLTGFSLFSRYAQLGGIFSMPESVILIHYVSVTVILFAYRLLVKIVFRFATKARRSIKKALIYGAGDMGFIVKRVLLSDPQSGFDVSGFLDDDKRLQGKKINSLPVYNPANITREFIQKKKINVLVIAIKNLSPVRKSEIIKSAIDFGVEILETPSVDSWLNGQLHVRQLQKVKFEDLLGRDQIQLNMDLIGNWLNDKTILVTGAAGSIGSEIVRQLARFNIKKAILVDQAETPMYHLESELKKKFGNLQFKLIIGDITNTEKMELIFREFSPEIVFHAAAYKHVPLMEENPHEAIRVNVGGTMLVTDLAIKYGVKKFVMISSDKSVNPANVMGASKRICEMIVQSHAQAEGVKTHFVITRFGNVLGSNGSVIPLFNQQIRDGGPVTVTHPDITRFFMTIPEACELVLEASFMGNGGEIFVFDMGEPVKITDLAYQMIRLSGLVPNEDIKIEFTGLRPGEKLFEELLTQKENILPTYHKKIKIAQVERLDREAFTTLTDELLHLLYTLPKEKILEYLGQLVPEYKRNDGSVRSDSVTKSR